MKTKQQALKELEKQGKTAKGGYYHGFRDAIAFIFEDSTIYKK